MNLPSDTFCILPWVHLSTRPDGSMRVCCTANASSVGPTNDKEHGGMVGVLKDDEGRPNNLNITEYLAVELNLQVDVNIPKSNPENIASKI